MKSRVPVAIFLILAATQFVVKAGVIERKYSTGKYIISSVDKYTLIRFNQSFLSGKAGEPAMPYQQVNLLLPPGQTAVSVKFSGEGLTEIPGEYTVYPYQYNRPLSEGESAGEGFMINDLIYRRNTALPSGPTGKLTTQYLHGYPVACCTFTPLVFNPALKKIWYYKEVKITIQTRNDKRVSSHLPVSTTIAARQIIRKFIQNPEVLSFYPPVTSDTADYEVLIVAPDIFSGHFINLIDEYFVRGMKSKVIKTETIYADYPGQDSQEKIRNCIIHEYLNNHIKHVLLAGDVELVPARGFWAQVQSSSLYVDYNIPSDLYYAALDGNWNTDGDDKWGEPGEDDLLPELSVGRFTVNTTGELDNIINKTIHYQTAPINADCRKPLMVGEKLWDNPLTWGGDYLDLLIGPHSDNGYTTEGIPAWHNIQKLYDRDLPSPWTLSDLLTRINQGTSFIHHSGHTNTNYLMRMYSSSVTNSNFSQINGIDHNYIPVYSHGCYCAAFDASDCIAEQMLNISNFAVAFVGNSRYGWFNEGTTEGPSEHLHREFMNALYGEGIGQIGAAHTLSKINTAPWVNAPGQWEEGALRWCFYDCNVLGDPAMYLWTDTPINLAVTHEDTINAGAGSVTIQCDSANSPIQGLTCIALKDSTLLGKSITDSTGNALIPLSLQPSDTGLITIIVSGYNCLPDTSFIHVIEMAGVSGVISYDNQASTPLDSVWVLLMQQEDTIAQALTDSTGHFSIRNVMAGQYEVKIGCGHSWGGVNSTDALQILRHFVHIIQLNGLALKASDIDNNHVTNSVDAFAVQKRFVGLMNYFPSGDWTFENKTINIGQTGETIVNIRGLCLGDVNKSYYPND